MTVGIASILEDLRGTVVATNNVKMALGVTIY
jgi:hypothetical protein